MKVRKFLHNSSTDIVDALQKVDNEQNMSSFVAQNIEKLPDRQPEKLNLLHIINKLSNIEKNIKEQDKILLVHEVKIANVEKTQIDGMSIKDVISQACTEIKKDIDENKEKYTDIDNICESDENMKRNDKTESEKYTNKCNELNKLSKDSDININKNEERDTKMFEDFLDNCKIDDKNSMSLVNYDNINVPLDFNDNFTQEAIFNEETLRYSDVTKCKFKKDLKKEKNNRRRAMSPAILLQDSAKKKNQRLEEDEDGFILVTSGKKRRKTSVSSEESIIGAKPALSSIWIYKIEGGTEKAVKKYLNEQGVRVQKITRTSHQDARYKSFKITILSADIKNVMKRNFWPIGVECRNWKDKNRTRIYANSRNNVTYHGLF